MKLHLIELLETVARRLGKRSRADNARVAGWNLALTVVLGCSAFFVTSSPAQQFTDVSVEAGLHRELTRAWGNPMWGDFNNDGLLDLFVPNHETPSGVKEGGILPYIYINNGNGTFTDVIATSGIMEHEPDTGAWQGISIGDYDSDGNLDVYIAEPPFGGGNATTRDLLYKGHGDATWEYVSDVAGILTARHYGECSFFVDYDNDGRVDIFVKNIPNNKDETGVNVLYHNNGDGTFSVVPGAGGLEDAEHGVDEGTICSFADYDNDGYMDVAFSGNGVSEALYHNNGNGTFTDVTLASGLTPRGNALGLAWGDYDNDGLIDLYISRGKQNGMGVLNNTLYRNQGNGTFSDVTSQAQVDDGTNTWAAVWGDYDNDGFLDLFVVRPGMHQLGVDNANILYHNNQDGTFTDVAAQEGVALEDDLLTSSHKLAAWGDYNNDGFLDLVVKDGISPNLATGDAYIGRHFLLKNNGNSNHYIKVNLHGIQSNRQGLGARVTATYTGGFAFRENNGGGGGEYASQGAGPLHFGIGAASTATIKVNWPSGTVDTISGVSANATIEIVEGSGGLIPPAITQQPRNQTVVEEQRATFKVKATGSDPLSYQWKKNDADIPGATRASYVTPPATLSDDGTRFSVVVSNTAGSVTSRTARLRVTSATGAVNPPGRIWDLGLASQLRATATSFAQPEWNQAGIPGAKPWHGRWFDPVPERN
jgi:hypothetical protein